MNFFDLLFSFRGRIGRLGWWLMGLVQTVMMMVATVPLTKGWAKWGQLVEAHDPSAARTGWTLLAVSLIAVVLIAWVGLAANVKRFHDRNKSGWWLLIAFVPAIGALWLSVELGFFGSVNDGNRFDLPEGPGFGGGDGGGLRADADDIINAWRNRAPEPTPAMARATAHASDAGSSAWGHRHAPVVTRSSNAGGGFGRRGRA